MKQQCYNSDEYAEIDLAVTGLVCYSYELSQKHFKDPSIQHNFQRQYSQMGLYLIHKYNNGEIEKESLIDKIKEESQNLFEQSSAIAKYGIGLAAGFAQIYGGVGICAGGSAETIGAACYFVGAPLVLHGFNNVYENGASLINLGANNNTVGYLKRGYRAAANLMGYDDSAGDIAYGVVDLTLSAYGLINQVRSYDYIVEGAKQFNLFRALADDYVKGMKSMGPVALGTEIVADLITMKGVYDSADN
ncbi:DUF4225 domain-containing protein [Photobacterium halotolerans]|uniref:DUF4225 domain-containing protein n=1 Tax=Photobacterium halotolerans TaxID=265726 RepID=UPI001372FC30|nr:DUF4225 domain-containing protein [Photobacterium halotolerans]NAX47411.1 DUF4225 domain-containing protein [Photobacterium halotolerans]